MSSGVLPLPLPYAARIYATVENTRTREDGPSPRTKRFGARPDFLSLPLGCKVWLILAPTSLEEAKAAPRLVTGISLGFRITLGGRFGGVNTLRRALMILLALAWI